jgi:hypothetical protein
MQMPPGFGDALKSCCDIHAVTKDVVALDQDIAKVDTNPEQHPPVFRDPVVTLGHHRLHCYRAFDRIDHRGKLKQNAIARGFDYSPAMLHD